MVVQAKIASKVAETAVDNSGAIALVAVVGVLAAVQVTKKAGDLAGNVVGDVGQAIVDAFKPPTLSELISNVKANLQRDLEIGSGLVSVDDENAYSESATYDIDGVPIAVPVMVDQDDGLIAWIRGWF